jgi:hypothetical protein
MLPENGAQHLQGDNARKNTGVGIQVMPDSVEGCGKMAFGRAFGDRKMLGGFVDG